ncbi:MAG TPA: hypothetical protein VFO80_11795 [Sphingomonas sp.]|nr:hypothetical protein [Sphingomonas sp.]
MKTAHTPAPWMVSPFKAVVTTDAFGRDGDFLPVAAMLWPTDERSEAETYSNARLIAAAPDLLEVAQDSVEILDVAIEQWNERYPREPDEVLTDLRRRFVAAIHKATQA